MMDRGIVPTATHGSMRCQSASRSTSKLPVINALNVTVFEANVTIVFQKPSRFCRLYVSANGGMERPAERRPEGGIQNGVSLRMIAKRYANIKPSQNTGIETPIFAPSIVTTSAAVLRRTAENTPSK